MTTKTKKRAVAAGATAIGMIAACVVGAMRVHHGTASNSREADLPEVVVTRPVVHDVPVFIDAVGTVRPTASVDIRPRMDGLLEYVSFDDGQHVRAGQTLARIDCRQQIQGWRQAQAVVDKDFALLENAKRDVERYGRLIKGGALPTQTFDAQESLQEQYKAQWKSDIAHANDLKIQLGYCTIESPVDGIIGLRNVDAGNLVHQSDPNPLATVATMNPAKVTFQLSVADSARVHRAMLVHPLEVTFVSNTSPDPIHGLVQALDNHVDVATGTVKAEGITANTGRVLFADEYVRVRVHLGVLSNALLVPAKAIQHDDQVAFVLVVGKDGIARRENVEVGSSFGDKTVIVRGLSLSDAVVAEGGDQVHLGKGVHMVWER